MPDCNYTLPEVDFSEDCAGETYASEIEELFIAKADAIPFTDWEDAAEWASRLSDTASVSGNEIRRLIVIGDKPAAQSVMLTVSKKRKKKVDATHQLNFDVDDLTQKNYDFALAMQEGRMVRAWWKNRGQNMFGGNEGVLAFMEINPVSGRGDEIEKLIGNLAWNSVSDPERVASPI